MTVNPRVNPKKLRPYDQPPKRRRVLIPDRPDSAAIGFLVLATLWLAFAAGLGVLAIGLRIVPFEMSIPFGIFDLGFELDARRVDHAFINATVYGWLTNAGFGAIAFFTPRLTGQRLALEKALNAALVLWNLTLLGGIGSLYVFDLGPQAPLTVFPWLIDGGLAFAALIVAGAFFAAATATMRGAYVSLWFAAVALLGLLGLLGLDATIGLVDWIIGLDDVLMALASAFIDRALVTVWLLGMAYAVLHYVVPRAAAQPLAWGGVAWLTWLAWLALAPASALAVLVDVSIPFFVTTLGEVATMLLIVPAGLAVGNLVATMQGRWTILFGRGAGAMAAVALAFLFGASLVEAIGALRDVRMLVGGTEWVDGAFIWVAYGAFTFTAFALADHAFPRILRRAGGVGLLSSAQLWLGFGGAALAGVVLMGAGLAEGSMLAQPGGGHAEDPSLMVYRGFALAAFGLVALSGLAMLANLFLMYTSSEPIAYVAPGQPAPAGAGH
jgi:cbb3-type cytochrome oxidase subunit 1